MKPATVTKIDEWKSEESFNKIELLVQFLIETGVIDPLDWQAYLTEQKKLT